MLSKKDKEWLLQMMDERIRKALTVKMHFEQVRDLKTGQPLAKPIVEVRDVYLPAHWCEFLPFYEGCYRGVQETTDRVKNNVANQSEKLQLMANILIQSKDAMERLVGLASDIKAVEIANPEETKALKGETDVDKDSICKERS